MSDIKIDSKEIIKIAKTIDKAGNNNKRIDGDEISVFADKLRQKGISDAKTIINSYNSNRLYYETIFEKNGSTVDDSNKNAIIGAINNNSFLVKSKNIKQEAADIVSNIHKGANDTALGFIPWSDEDLVKQKVDAITKDNVLSVLNAEYPDKKSNVIKDIVSALDESDIHKAGYKIIKALCEVAASKGVDVASIVIIDENNEKLSVGPDVKGVKFGSSATGKDNIEKVVYALKEAIDSNYNLLTDEKSAKKDKNKSLLAIAQQIDSISNGNGYIDGDEVFKFKAACANVGISVSDMISSIQTKTKKKVDLTSEEKTLKQIFDSATNMAEAAAMQRDIKYVASGINQAIEDEDTSVLEKSIAIVSSENVEEVLTALKDNDIAQKLVDKFGEEKSKQYTKSIISALYSKAEKNDIDVGDIVKVSGDKFIVGAKIGDLGADALSKKYVNKVVNELRARINEELGE